MIQSKESDVAPTLPVVKDNKVIAIISMNVAALCSTGMTVTYRVIAKEGFHAADYNLYRNVLSFTVIIVWLWIAAQNPFKLFPRERKCLLLFRILCGQVNFILIHLAAVYAPISLTMVCW